MDNRPLQRNNNHHLNPTVQDEVTSQPGLVLLKQKKIRHDACGSEESAVSHSPRPTFSNFSIVKIESEPDSDLESNDATCSSMESHNNNIVFETTVEIKPEPCSPERTEDPFSFPSANDELKLESDSPHDFTKIEFDSNETDLILQKIESYDKNKSNSSSTTNNLEKTVRHRKNLSLRSQQLAKKKQLLMLKLQIQHEKRRMVNAKKMHDLEIQLLKSKLEAEKMKYEFKRLYFNM